MKAVFPVLSNLQSNFHLKLDFQNLIQHTGGKWLIHGTKYHKKKTISYKAWKAPVD